jgi:hypothetical protein
MFKAKGGLPVGSVSLRRYSTKNSPTSAEAAPDTVKLPLERSAYCCEASIVVIVTFLAAKSAVARAAVLIF